MMRPRLVPGPKIDNESDDEVLRLAQEFYETMQRRRTFRDFFDRPVPRGVIAYCIRAAGPAPSGANLQPWHFVAVNDPVVKHQIRIAAEKEEKEFYAHRAPKAWLGALAPLGPDSRRPFLEIAPWRRLRAAVSNSGGRNQVANVLRDRVSGHRDGPVSHRSALVWIGFVNPYAESDGISESHSRTAIIRETFCASCCWSSSGKRTGSRYWTQITRGDQFV